MFAFTVAVILELVGNAVRAAPPFECALMVGQETRVGPAPLELSGFRGTARTRHALELSGPGLVATGGPLSVDSKLVSLTGRTAAQVTATLTCTQHTGVRAEPDLLARHALACLIDGRDFVWAPSPLTTVAGHVTLRAAATGNELRLTLDAADGRFVGLWTEEPGPIGNAWQLDALGHRALCWRVA